MQYKTIVNGVDLTPFLREGGVEQETVVRQKVQIVTLGGTLIERGIEKRRLVLDFMQLRDAHKDAVTAALKAANPAAVEYTDKDAGDVTRRFYITEDKAGVRKVSGGNTYWHNMSVTLEEV